ncbi:hypothetical protein AVEN_125889-1 [Araneus ventricosus]|uniref:Uncharacterized protein n=1 Tax=Araneus ventricosus TaxID=182803 RepID=A0A4Y2NNE0_ARAVE|nr:hypothetical protein AVEN_125889-1 [Araneus ventricosus]
MTKCILNNYCIKTTLEEDAGFESMNWRPKGPLFRQSGLVSEVKGKKWFFELWYEPRKAAEEEKELRLESDWTLRMGGRVFAVACIAPKQVNQRFTK